MGVPPGVRLYGPGGLTAGLGGAQPASDGGAEPGPVKVAVHPGEGGLAGHAAGLVAGSRQDREEPLAGTLLSGQAGLGPVR